MAEIHMLNDPLGFYYLNIYIHFEKGVFGIVGKTGKIPIKLIEAHDLGNYHKIKAPDQYM